MTDSDPIETAITEDYCCERCGEVVHTHFDCPACNTDYAPTDIYGRVAAGDRLTCNGCDTPFRVLDREWTTITIREVPPKG